MRRHLIVVAVVAGALTWLAWEGGGSARQPATSGARIEVSPLTAVLRPVTVVVAPGDTIEAVSRRLAGADWPRWRDALSGEIDPRRLRPGLALRGLCGDDGRLRRLEAVLDARTDLIFEPTADGIVSRREVRAIDHAERRFEGTIESSLFAAVEAAGGDPELAVRIAEIFQWDVDFFRDLRRGDSFVVIVDEQRVDGRAYAWGPIYAARFVNAGRVLDALLYPDSDGTLGYYDPQGRPLRKQFLRSPLKLSRVTSHFNLRRFHPVLKRTMPHYGVDYGAPVGTPVHVTGDGVVTFVGRNGGAGKMVRVRHTNGFETAYLHLSRYGQGIRSGTRVSQGQVIGYVGSTGLSSGPHLDYRVKHNGRWINPLQLASPPAKPLDEDRLERFLAHSLAVAAVLAGHQPPTGSTC